VKLTPAPEGYAAHVEWQKRKVTEFSLIREKFENWRKTVWNSDEARQEMAQLRKTHCRQWAEKAFPESFDQQTDETKSASGDGAGSDEVEDKSERNLRDINSMMLTPMCTVFWPKTDETDASGPLLGERLLEEEDPSGGGQIPLTSHIISMPQVR
jgi:hypothetical protein